MTVILSFKRVFKTCEILGATLILRDAALPRHALSQQGENQGGGDGGKGQTQKLAPALLTPASPVRGEMARGADAVTAPFFPYRPARPGKAGQVCVRLWKKGGQGTAGSPSC